MESAPRPRKVFSHIIYSFSVFSMTMNLKTFDCFKICWLLTDSDVTKTGNREWESGNNCTVAENSNWQIKKKKSGEFELIVLCDSNKTK